MDSDAWRRMAVWELRRALRGRPLWVMLLAAGAAPLLCGREHLLDGPYHPGALAVAAVLAVGWLTTAWILVGLKRQCGPEPADDWLLATTWSATVRGQLAAGAVVGLLLALAAVLGDWTALLRSGQWLTVPALGGALAVVASVIQPLTIAALLATQRDGDGEWPRGALFLGLLWVPAGAILPTVGCTWAAILLADDANRTGLMLLLSWPVWALVLWWACGWLGRQPWDDNAAVRRANATRSSARRQRVDREAAAAYRQWLRRWGLPSPLLVELARRPPLPWRWLYRDGGWSLCVPALLLGLTALAVTHPLGRVGQLDDCVPYDLALLAVALAALVRAVDAGLAERERGTLEALVLTPTRLTRLWDYKLVAVCVQVLPAGLLAVFAVRGLLAPLSAAEVPRLVAGVALLVLAAAAGGLSGAAESRARVLALLAGVGNAAMPLVAGLAPVMILSLLGEELGGAALGDPLSRRALVLVGVLLAVAAGWLVRRAAGAELARTAATARPA